MTNYEKIKNMSVEEMAGSGVREDEQDVYSSTNHSCGRGGHCCIFRRDRLWSEL